MPGSMAPALWHWGGPSSQSGSCPCGGGRGREAGASPERGEGGGCFQRHLEGEADRIW